MIERIDDLVVLGRAAPEPIGDGRETVCLGGYSEEYGYVRLYPTKRRMQKLRRWNVISVPVERDPENDSRDESYKIAGSQADWDVLHNKVEKVGRLSKREQIQLTEKLAGDCTKALNQDHISLGVVEPEAVFDVRLEKTKGDNATQRDLEMNEIKGKGDYKHKIYIEYECDGCIQKSTHDQHCIEWGIYKYWDNNNDHDGVIDALGFGDPDWNHWFFVGNLNHRRTAYILISILRFKNSTLAENGFSVSPGDNQSQLGEY